jgi:hypothetical protein
MVSVRPRTTLRHATERTPAGWRGGVTRLLQHLPPNCRRTSARSAARRSPDARTGLRTGMCHTAQTKCAVVHIVYSPWRVKRVVTQRVSELVAAVDRGSVPRRTLLRWHRRRACRSIQDEQPCRAESAHALDAASWYTSQPQSTAASNAVRLTPRDTSACATRRAKRQRVPYRCCANFASTSPPPALIPKHN